MLWVIYIHTQWEFTIKSDLVGSSSRKSCTLDLAAIAFPHKVSIFGEIMSPEKKGWDGGARFSLHGGGCWEFFFSALCVCFFSKERCCCMSICCNKHMYIHLEPKRTIFGKIWPIKWKVNSPKTGVSWVVGVYIIMYRYTSFSMWESLYRECPSLEVRISLCQNTTFGGEPQGVPIDTWIKFSSCSTNLLYPKVCPYQL